MLAKMQQGWILKFNIQITTPQQLALLFSNFSFHSFSFQFSMPNIHIVIS